MKVGDKVIAVEEYRVQVHGHEDAYCTVEKGTLGRISCVAPVFITWLSGITTYARAEQYRLIKPRYVTAEEAERLGYAHNGMMYYGKANAEWAVTSLMEQGKDVVIVPIVAINTILGYAIATRGERG